MSPQDDDRVTLQEAATRLGLSERTIRRRIRTGRMLAELVPGPRGPQYLLLLSVDERIPDAAELAARPPADDALPSIGEGHGHADIEHELAALRYDLAAMRQGMARQQEQMAALVALLRRDES